nr:TRIO and F-actin-binding protein-like isoform X2 [Ipomoea batatas]
MVWRNGLVVRASAPDRLVVRASAPDRLVVRASAPDRLVVRASAPERSVVRASAHMLSLLLVLRWDLVFRMDWCSVGLEAGSSVQGWPPVTTPFLSGGELGGPAGGVRTSGQQLPSPVDGSLTEQGAATTSSRLPGGVTRQPRRSLDVARQRSSGEDGRQPQRRSLLLDVLHAATVNLIWSLSPCCDSKKQIERSWPTVLSLPPPSTARQRRSTWTALPTPRGISVPAAKLPSDLPSLGRRR